MFWGLFWVWFYVNNFHMLYKLVFLISGKFLRPMFYFIKKHVSYKNNVIFKIAEERKSEVYLKKSFTIVGTI